MASGPGNAASADDVGARHDRRVSPWGPIVFVLVAALSVVAFAVIRQGVDRQQRALLTNDAQQIEVLLQQAFQNVQTELRTVAFTTSQANYSPTVFTQQATPLLAQPGVSVAVVDTSGSSPKVVIASGPNLAQGQTLSPAVAAVARSGGTALSSMIVHDAGKTLLAVAAGPSIVPHTVALELSVIDPTKVTPNRSGPYDKVYVNLYASPKIHADQLVLTTYGPGTLPQPVATAPLKVGALSWLIAVSPRTALVGGTAQATPWIVLGIGLFVAALLAVFVELLARRQRYARELVEERTAELVSAQRTLVRQERLAAVGEMASVVSHELRNPLSAVINDLFLLRHRLGDHIGESGERHLSNAEREVYRAARLSEDLLAYTREREPQRRDIELEALLAEVLETTPAPDGIELSIDASVQLQADPALMTQVLSNVINNAFQAMPDGGQVRVSARRDGTGAIISVEDGGPGVDAELAARIFDPFFTTKEGGTGLGLAIVQRLVEAHDGRVSIDNVPGGGARVTIEIPDGEAAA